MFRRSLALLLSSLLLIAISSAQAEDNPEQVPETELEGTWEMISCVINGDEEEVNSEEPFQVHIQMHSEGDKAYFWSGNNEVGCGFSLDPSAMPPHCEWINNIPVVSISHRGIYDLDGDTLIICIGHRDERPDAFESTDDKRWMLITYHRITEEDDQ